MSVGSCNVQVPLYQQGRGAKEGSPENCPGRARVDAGRAGLGQAQAEGHRNGIDSYAAQAHGVREEEGRSGGEHEGVRSKAHQSRQGTVQSNAMQLNLLDVIIILMGKDRHVVFYLLMNKYWLKLPLLDIQ